MRMIGKCTILFALSGLAALTGCSTSEPSRPEDDPPPSIRLGDDADFYARLRRVEGIEASPVQTMSELSASAELVVTGHFDGVEDGRTFGGELGDLGAVHSMVLRFAVSEVKKGTAGGMIYVEFLRTLPTDIAGLKRTLPTGDEVSLYLRDASAVAHQDVRGEGRGHPAGTNLYTLSSQLGLMVSVGGEPQFPLVERDLYPKAQ